MEDQIRYPPPSALISPRLLPRQPTKVDVLRVSTCYASSPAAYRYISFTMEWNITRWLFFCIPATLILLSARFEAFSMPWKTLPLKKRKFKRAACSVFIHLLLPFWLRLFDFWSHILPLLLLIPRSRLSLELGRKCRRKQDFSTLTFMLLFAFRILPCLH